MKNPHSGQASPSTRRRLCPQRGQRNRGGPDMAMMMPLARKGSNIQNVGRAEYAPSRPSGESFHRGQMGETESGRSKPSPTFCEAALRQGAGHAAKRRFEALLRAIEHSASAGSADPAAAILAVPHHNRYDPPPRSRACRASRASPRQRKASTTRRRVHPAGCVTSAVVLPLALAVNDVLR